MNMISSTTDDRSKGKAIVDKISMSPPKSLYDSIQSTSDGYIDDHHLVASHPYHIPYWLDSPPPTLDDLSHTFPSNESIMEIMSLDETQWEDHHHKSSFLPNSNFAESNFVSFITFDIVNNIQSLMFKHRNDSEGNLCNITQTIPTGIFVNLGVVEHVHIGQNCAMNGIEIYMAHFK